MIIRLAVGVFVGELCELCEILSQRAPSEESELSEVLLFIKNKSIREFSQYTMLYQMNWRE